jgi:Leu/Phe-tRNA-protein transferase
MLYYLFFKNFYFTFNIRLSIILSFIGKSMFSYQSNASKLALIWLCQNIELKLIDCQIHSDHLASLVAKMIERDSFMVFFKKVKNAILQRKTFI